MSIIGNQIARILLLAAIRSEKAKNNVLVGQSSKQKADKGLLKNKDSEESSTDSVIHTNQSQNTELKQQGGGYCV